MNTLTLVWTAVTGVGVVVLAFIGWAILNALSQSISLLMEIAKALRVISGDLDQARMSDQLWQAVDRVATDRGDAA